MDGDVSGQTARETVRFYLLDQRTVLGEAIDIALLLLNLLFVCLFVVETYPIADRFRDLFWTLEVAIAGVFVVEYALRLYGAENRLGEFLNGYTIVDLLAILPTLLLVVFPESILAAIIVIPRQASKILKE